LKTGTIWAAEYILKGNQLGSLETGKLADLVVLDRDYMAIPVEQIHEIQPQVTVFDGKIVFVHSQFAQEYSLRPAGAVVSTYEALMARRPDAAGVGD
jgi:cytosine/adenosine deaminase-related metal-dependent hydrolase